MIVIPRMTVLLPCTISTVVLRAMSIDTLCPMPMSKDGARHAETWLLRARRLGNDEYPHAITGKERRRVVGRKRLSRRASTRCQRQISIVSVRRLTLRETGRKSRKLVAAALVAGNRDAGARSLAEHESRPGRAGALCTSIKWGGYAAGHASGGRMSFLHNVGMLAF
jgi:hypothetical protein